MSLSISMKVLIISIFLVIVTVHSSVDSHSQIEQEFKKWMVLHGRVYKDDAERAVRFAAFRKKWLEIEAFNSGPDRGYKLGVNQFSDEVSSDGEFKPCYVSEKYKSKKYLRKFAGFSLLWGRV